MQSKVVCAGGYVLSMLTKWKVPYNDIDLFIAWEDWKRIDARVNMDDYVYSDFAAVKAKKPLQYIYLKKAQPPTPMEVIGTFDLTVCQVAIYGGKLYMTAQAKEDIARRQFHVIPRNVKRSGSTYRRIQKYIRRGFKFKGELEELDDILGLGHGDRRRRWN